MEPWIAVLIGAGVTILGVFLSVSWAIRKETKDVRDDLNSGIRASENRLERRLDRQETRLSERITRTDNRLTGLLHTVLAGVVRSKATAANSPLHLTEAGRRISRELGGKAWAAREARTLAPGNISGYELQGFCFTHVSEAAFPADLRGKIRDTAQAEEVDESEVLSVLAIELRDALLALQKESGG